jgi:hypothetical protein
MYVIAAASVSAAANVLTEWALKRNQSDSLLWQNCQLYAYSTVCTFVALVSLP